MLPRLLRGRRGVLVVLVLALVVAAAVAGYLFAREPGNVSHPNVEFSTTENTPAPPPPPPRRHVPLETFVWPYYGFDAARTKHLLGSGRVRPPFRRRWTYRTRVLLEFPPVLDHGMLFVLRNDGFLVAIRARTGHVRWSRRLGKLAAAAPAVGRGIVWAVLLRRGKADRGRVAALRQANGRILWSRDLPSRAESSPLLLGGRIYFGTEDGTVYALRARDGRVAWRFRAAGAVKAGLAYADGKLYFGDYAGMVYAVRARTGAKLWAVGSSGSAFGGSGQFYSTPAVAFGRVFMGNTDGRVYSYAASSGKLAWATRTGAYVYSSPAVANVKGHGPTVFAGSYDGHFYAFDARSGRVRWSYAAGGKISGGATIVGDLVFYAQLAARRTDALGLKTGIRRWSFPDGAFNPVISDRRWLYLTGYGSIYALAPRRR